MRVDARRVALVHGAVFVTSGLWPVIHLRSFEAVTGRKKEGWLVRTVGLLLASIGTTLGVAAYRRRIVPELRILGVLSSGTLATVAVVYAGSGRISPVYLLDVVLECSLISAWLLARVPGTRAGAPLATSTT